MAVGDNLQVGTGRGVNWKGVELPASSWSLSRTAGVIDMVNARDGHNRKKTLKDFTGSVSFFYDTDVEPGAEITDGDQGVLRLYLDEAKTRYIEMTLAVIDNVSIDTGGQNGAMSGSFDFALARGSTIVEPV